MDTLMRSRNVGIGRITASVAAAWFLLPIAALAQDPRPVETLRVELSLRSGGGISGAVVEHGDDGLVIVHQRTPYAFSWRALTPKSAMETRKRLLLFARGNALELAADDYFALGGVALKLDKPIVATHLMREAQELDPSLEVRVRSAFADYRERIDTNQDAGTPFETHPMAAEADHPSSGDHAPPGLGRQLTPQKNSDEVRAQVDAIYRVFGDKVREVLGDDIVLIETEHFLIWTDWLPREHARLARWPEAMYEALCRQFDIDPSAKLFLAKCPMFCWRSRERFVRFARDFDGHDGSDAAGYTRSVEREGHVHVVLLRMGHDSVDFDRFAATLVHEGTHALIHRLYATRLIPHWVNEGLAELMSERVLRDRSDAGEEAALLARAYARYDWPLNDLLNDPGPIAVPQYALAGSIVGYLDHLGTDRLAAFLRGLKDGRTIAEALEAAYDGLTPQRLEDDWRRWIRETDPVLNPPDTEDSRLPWRR